MTPGHAAMWHAIGMVVATRQMLDQYKGYEMEFLLGALGNLWFRVAQIEHLILEESQ